MLQQGAFEFLNPANVHGYCTLIFLEQKDMLKLNSSDGTEVANEYTKIVTTHLAWVNLCVINNDNAERI